MKPDSFHVLNAVFKCSVDVAVQLHVFIVECDLGTDLLHMPMTVCNMCLVTASHEARTCHHREDRRLHQPARWADGNRHQNKAEEQPTI